MPKGYNWLGHGVQLPEGTKEGWVSLWRSEGERRIAYYSQDLTTANSAPYWTALFAVREGNDPIMATYDGRELRWSTSLHCTKPDYLVADGTVNDVVRLSSNTEYGGEIGQWYRWIELRARAAHSLEAGQLAAFLAQNIGDQSAHLHVMILHDSSSGPSTSAQDVFHATLGEF